MERQKRRRMLTAQRHSRGVIARCLDSSVVSGLYRARICPCLYSVCVCVCKALCACVCVHCSHRQTHGSLRSGEYYRGVDHRGTRPIANRQAPLINPFHTDASPLRLCLSLSVNLSLFFYLFHLTSACRVSLSPHDLVSFSWKKSIRWWNIH